MRLKWVIGTLLGLAAVAALIFLIFKTRSVSPASYNRNVEYLQELQRIDAAWNVEALKSQLSFTQDFDIVASFLPRIRTLKTALLASEISDPSRMTPAIADLLNQYIRLLEEKEAEIERFKSGHALLRNSVRFLPEAGEALIEVAEKNRFGDLALEVKSELKDIFLYIQEPQEALKSKIEAWLNTNVMNYPPAVANPAANFLSHARLILSRKAPTDANLELLISLPTAATAANLIDLYSLNYNQQLVAVDRYRMFLIIYSVLLLLIVLVVGANLVRSYGAVERARALKEANKTLELRVQQRTGELTEAYQKLKGSQAQLVHSSKMAAVGQLVAGVAHEINTPLGYVTSNVEIFEETLGEMDAFIGPVEELNNLVNAPEAGEDEIARQLAVIGDRLEKLKHHDMIAETRALIGDARYGLAQIAEIVQSLKGFSRVDLANFEEIDLHDCIESTLKVAHNLLKNSAKVVKEYGDLPKVTCSPAQLNQVILNLITNAVHGIEVTKKKGIIKVKTRRGTDFAHIAIYDNGVGMDEATTKKIFEPFFTTKSAGKGTGLGLPISLNIIKEHGGHLNFKSVPGKGTVFQISLPLKPVGKTGSASRLLEEAHDSNQPVAG